MDGLKFLDTWSISQFKQNHQVNKIEIKKNEETGKCFFTFGIETGAVSKKLDTRELTNPVISQVCLPTTGEMFYLLHQKGENRAMTIATL